MRMEEGLISWRLCLSHMCLLLTIGNVFQHLGQIEDIQLQGKISVHSLLSCAAIMPILPLTDPRDLDVASA